MKNRTELTRETIIKTLIDALEPLEYVHAFWEGGAVAFDRVDEWSDIDAYAVVDDEKVDETFDVVEEALKTLSPIRQKFEVSQLPWPDVSQAFYRLEDASEYLVLDLAVLKMGSPEKFLEPQIHGNVVFYFNKAGKVEFSRFDKDVFFRKLQDRLTRLEERFAMFNNFVQKEINRGNYLEALDNYRVVTLAALTEALRIRHNPLHHDFKTRYVHYELPVNVIEKLKHFYFVEDEKDLQEKYRLATEWFHEMISEIDEKEMKRLLGI